MMMDANRFEKMSTEKSIHVKRKKDRKKEKANDEKVQIEIVDRTELQFIGMKRERTNKLCILILHILLLHC